MLLNMKAPHARPRVYLVQNCISRTPPISAASAEQLDRQEGQLRKFAEEHRWKLELPGDSAGENTATVPHR